MRLDGQSCLGGVRTHGAEHLVRTRRYEPRCDDRTYQSVRAVLIQMSFEHAHACHHLFCRVMQRVRAVAVHSYQTYIGTHAGLDKQVCQDTCGFRMDRTEHSGTHSPLHP